MRLTVQSHFCLTPKSTDKSIYYLTFSLPEGSDGSLNYQPGDWLTIQPVNRVETVKAILDQLNLQGDEEIELRRVGLVSVYEALEKHLELTQLNPAILNKLQRQMQIGDWQGRQEMIDYAYGKDILDLLQSFPQLQTLQLDFLSLLSPLAPRYYSIASSDAKQQQVSILYRQVCYKNNERTRLGVASNFLIEQDEGALLEVEIKNNPTFKLPEQADVPVIMVAAGTGLAPFIGFMQQKKHLSQQGQASAENLLFYGETHQATNCLFCEQFAEWQSQGLIKNHYAFSRDQAEKIYVSQRLLEQAEQVWQLIEKGAYFYICGSQDQLAVSVKEAMLSIFCKQGNLTIEQAEEYWNNLRKTKRLQQDVY